MHTHHAQQVTAQAHQDLKFRFFSHSNCVIQANTTLQLLYNTHHVPRYHCCHLNFTFTFTWTFTFNKYLHLLFTFYTSQDNLVGIYISLLQLARLTAPSQQRSGEAVCFRISKNYPFSRTWSSSISMHDHMKYLWVQFKRLKSRRHLTKPSRPVGVSLWNIVNYG